jgi:hypothetical protein
MLNARNSVVGVTAAGTRPEGFLTDFKAGWKNAAQFFLGCEKFGATKNAGKCSIREITVVTFVSSRENQSRFVVSNALRVSFRGCELKRGREMTLDVDY